MPSMEQRLNTINDLTPNEYKVKAIKTSTYSFYSIHYVKDECESINVYFEGDGLAWLTKSLISSNPTPLNPTTFKLMLQDSSNCKVYIARACQYISDNLCSKEDWTSHRFSQKILDATNEAIENLKQEYNNQTFTMIGFSGGGAIATLISAKRNDIKKLITYAGNLDTKKWTEIHNITKLNGSLNPADFTKYLENIPQIHYVGRYDKIMPIEVFKSYKSKFNSDEYIELIMLDAKHSDIYQ